MHGFEKWKLPPLHMYIRKRRKKEGERERMQKKRVRVAFKLLSKIINFKPE